MYYWKGHLDPTSNWAQTHYKEVCVDFVNFFFEKYNNLSFNFGMDRKQIWGRLMMMKIAYWNAFPDEKLRFLPYFSKGTCIGTTRTIYYIGNQKPLECYFGTKTKKAKPPACLINPVLISFLPDYVTLTLDDIHTKKFQGPTYKDFQRQMNSAFEPIRLSKLRYEYFINKKQVCGFGDLHGPKVIRKTKGPVKFFEFIQEDFRDILTKKG